MYDHTYLIIRPQALSENGVLLVVCDLVACGLIVKPFVNFRLPTYGIEKFRLYIKTFTYLKQ